MASSKGKKLSGSKDKSVKKVAAKKAAPTKTAKKVAAPAPARPASKGVQQTAKSVTTKSAAAKAATKPAASKSAGVKKPETKPSPRSSVKTPQKKLPPAAPAATKVASTSAKSAVAPAAAPGRIAKMTSASKEAVATVATPTKSAAKASKSKAPVLAGLMTEDQIRNAPNSDYMNDEQLVFFRERLLQMRGEVLARELEVKERLHQREVFADPADRASAEEEHWLDLRLRERESLLLRKIEDALKRIRDKEYGYCEKTGEPIGIARLLARPTATVCVDIKGQDERAESQYRDR
jgi:DnaK suppressor protein